MRIKPIVLISILIVVIGVLTPIVARRFVTAQWRTQIWNAGVLPLETGIWSAVPKPNHAGIGVPLLGGVVNGHANLNVKEQANHILTVSPIAPTPGGLDAVPWTIGSGGIEGGTSVILGLTTGKQSVPIGGGYALEVDVGSTTKASYEKVYRIELNKNEPEYFLSLSDVFNRTGGPIYIIDAVWLADINRSLTTGGALRFITPDNRDVVDRPELAVSYHENYSGLGVVIGVEMSRLLDANAKGGTIAQTGGEDPMNAFRAETCTAHRALNGETIIRFNNPFSGGKCAIRNTASGNTVAGATLSLGTNPGIFAARFVSVSGNQFCSADVQVEVEVGMGQPKLTCHAPVILRWEPLNPQTYARLHDLDERDHPFVMLDEGLRKLQVKLINLERVDFHDDQVNRTVVGALGADDPAVLNLARLVESASAMSNLTFSEQQKIDAARALVAWVRDKEAPALETVQEASRNSDATLQLAMVLWSVRGEAEWKKGNYETAAEAYGEAAKRQPDADIAATFRHRQAAALYQRGIQAGNSLEAKPWHNKLEEVMLSLQSADTFVWTGKDFDRDGVPSPWVKTEFTLPFSGKSHFKIEGGIFEIATNNFSTAVNSGCGFRVDERPFLAWDWRLDEKPPRGDCRVKETDDQGIQVIVIFECSDGEFRPLNYSWDSTAPQGTLVHRLVGPPGIRPMQIMMYYYCLRGGDASLGTWMAERRDLREDFEHAILGPMREEAQKLGDMPPNIQPIRVRAITVQSNTQYTRASARASIGPLHLTTTPVSQNFWNHGP